MAKIDITPIKESFSNFIETHKDNYIVCEMLISELVEKTPTPDIKEELIPLIRKAALSTVDVALENKDYEFAGNMIDHCNHIVYWYYNPSVTPEEKKWLSALFKRSKTVNAQALKAGNYKFAYEHVDRDVNYRGKYDSAHMLDYVLEVSKPLTMAVKQYQDYEFAEKPMEKAMKVLSFHNKGEEGFKASKGFDKIVSQALSDKQYSFAQPIIDRQLVNCYDQGDPKRWQVLVSQHNQMIEQAIEEENYKFVNDHSSSVWFFGSNKTALECYINYTDQAISIARQKKDNKFVKEALEGEKRILSHAQNKGEWKEKTASINAELENFAAADRKKKEKDSSPEKLQKVLNRFYKNFPVEQPEPKQSIIEKPEVK